MIKVIYHLKNGKTDEEIISFSDIEDKNLKEEHPYTFKSIKQIISLENIIYEDGKYDETLSKDLLENIKNFIEKHNYSFPLLNHTFYNFYKLKHNVQIFHNLNIFFSYKLLV